MSGPVRAGVSGCVGALEPAFVRVHVCVRTLECSCAAGAAACVRASAHVSPSCRPDGPSGSGQPGWTEWAWPTRVACQCRGAGAKALFSPFPTFLFSDFFV